MPPGLFLFLTVQGQDAGTTTLQDAALFMTRNCLDEGRFTLNAPPHVVSFYFDDVVGSLDESAG
jgi:hypothetical protein